MTTFLFSKLALMILGGFMALVTLDMLGRWISAMMGRKSSKTSPTTTEGKEA
jgi:hypothetical protein